MNEEDIKEFLKERDRIREVVGRIGGKPTKGEKAVNIIFVILVILAFIAALVFEGFPRLISIEIGILFVSLKIAYFLSNEAKVNHFEFWILSSMEWRLNDVIKRMDRMEKLLKNVQGADEKKKAEEA
ncbi:MAG: hypothetical protein J7K04_01550 [Spirochaetales bacterium]|nr:hypothetical protein [Spirochaetales bacterium]